jgi:hypothetical protein
VLDLEASVHLQEEDVAAVVEEELARAGADVADGPAEGQRRVGEPSPRRRADCRRRGLLEDLLVPSLDRTVALAEMNAGAMGIEEELDLDVTRPFEEPLEDQPLVAEGSERLPARGGKRGLEVCRSPDGAHALAAAAGGRLDEDRVADPARRPRQRGVVLRVAVVAGNRRDAEALRQLPRGGLVAHRPDRRRRRPDPQDPRIGHGLGEVRVLGEEAEARVDGVRSGSARRVDDSRDVEEVERLGPFGPGHDRRDSQRFARPMDADRDLAAVRHEQSADRQSLRGVGGPRGPLARHECVQRVRRDTPSTANSSSREPAGRDPALNGARRGADPDRGLARAQLLGHR